MEVNQLGVHASHCCKKCGCKYGSEECPVVTGEVEADFDCMDCENEKQDLISALENLDEIEFQEIFRIVQQRRNLLL